MSDQPLAEQIADHLRRDILRGTLAPGAAIKERDASAALGVSRTPLREAIRCLAQEGLVQLRPARSPIVANPTWKDVVDCIDVLTSLEELSARQACTRASDAEIDAIAQIQFQMEERAGHIDEIDLFETDMAFHRAIARAAHNDALFDMHTALLARLWRARFLGSRMGRSQARVFRQHHAILSGLRRRDPDSVGADVKIHLGMLKRQIRGYFDADTTGLTLG